MKTLIITGGNIEQDFALSFLEKLKPDYIIGVDHGLKFCFEHHVFPQYIVGDFDSLEEGILDWFRENSEIPIREYNPVKDATDTCIALEKAIEMKSEQIWILGGTGTRVDHLLCNLQILKKSWQARIPVWMVDDHNRISLPVGNAFSIQKKEQFGQYVSFFPLEERVEGLTLQGFKYPLDRYCLRNLEGLGVSNEITAEEAEVSWEKGILVMIESRD